MTKAGFFVLLLVIGGASLVSAQADAEIPVEHVEAAGVDLQPVIHRGSEILVEGRNRAATGAFVRGRVWTRNRASGETLATCRFEMQMPERTFVSRRTKCTVAGADEIRLEIDELISLTEAAP